MIITDAAINIRRVYDIISQMDVASPKSNCELFPCNMQQQAKLKELFERFMVRKNLLRRAVILRARAEVREIREAKPRLLQLPVLPMLVNRVDILKN